MTPASGGLRTALDELGRGYRAAGHEPVLIVPGATSSDVGTPQGRVLTLPGTELPGTGGYRVLADRGRLRRLLEALRPDRLEGSDRTTPRWRANGSGTPAPARAGTARDTVRFAALGDSLTEGGGEPVPGGRRGWAALLAEGLGATGQSVDFRNLAVAGALSADVHERQAGAAAEFRPDLASVVVGVDDTLRRSFDIRSPALRLDEVCALLAGGGAVLLTACPPDPVTALGLPGPLRHPLARRRQAVNAVVHALSARYDTVHLHASDREWTRDRSLWSVDRLHPAERGHRRLAAGFHRLLAERGLALGAPPGPEPGQPPPTRLAGALWLARRSTDLLPQLLGLAAAEPGHRARGTSDRLDARAEEALREALDDLPRTPLLRGFVPHARMEG
ncbi:GDSL-type esterase/lipase family protein [Streptomyces sp. NPDC053728]|uniref:GDSL-type esterase/lipase family protein n=1 Tax=Streptomyces sp. NPDC053728 TaxID=3155534 RepID=UPI003437C731